LQNDTNQQLLFESKAGFKAFVQLSKFRLTFLVVVTAVLGYVLGVAKVDSAVFHFGSFLGLIIGGFLLTASSNALNQILEKDSDKLMSRTQNRPLATERMSVTEAIIFVFVSGISSLLILGLALNATAAFLGLGSLITYAFLYTPAKKMSPIAVFIGAFPGAVPPMIGYVGATGQMSFEAVMIFGIQFFWQFPHFWSLAWVLHEDYQKAGYFMLPSRQGRTKRSAFQIVWYTLIMTLMSTVPFYLKYSGITYLIIALISGVIMIWFALQLFKTLQDKEAKRLMFASFLYIPIILIALLF
jgi:protoheme IX farnesyltransferase